MKKSKKKVFVSIFFALTFNVMCNFDLCSMKRKRTDELGTNKTSKKDANAEEIIKIKNDIFNTAFYFFKQFIIESTNEVELVAKCFCIDLCDKFLMYKNAYRFDTEIEEDFKIIQCSVCLEKLTEEQLYNNRLCKHNICEHLFHRNCSKGQWEQMCPLCKQNGDLVQVNEDYLDEMQLHKSQRRIMHLINQLFGLLDTTYLDSEKLTKHYAEKFDEYSEDDEEERDRRDDENDEDDDFEDEDESEEYDSCYPFINPQKK